MAFSRPSAYWRWKMNEIQAVLWATPVMLVYALFSMPLWVLFLLVFAALASAGGGRDD
jgi:hypothetical protein